MEKQLLAYDIRRSSDHDSYMINFVTMLGVVTSKGLGVDPSVRGRKDPDCWGLPYEQEDTDNDSLLLLRLMILAHIIHMRYEGPGLPWCFLEHPEDPKLCSKSPHASRCSTIWKNQAVRSWLKSLSLATIQFISINASWGSVWPSPQSLPRTSHCAIGQGCPAPMDGGHIE